MRATARAAFAEIRNGEVALLGLDGEPFHGSPRDIDVLLLSRLDCDVRCLELPPVAEREIASLVRYRLRSVYPGSLENAAIHHLVQRRTDGLVAVVSIVERAALEKVRAAAPRAELALVATTLVGKPPRAGGWVVCEAPGYTEALEFRDGLLVQSMLVRRNGAASEQRLRRLLGGEPVDALALTSVQPRRRGARSLFRPPRRWKVPRPAVTRAALAAAVVLFGVGLVQKQVSLRQAELATLRGAILGGQAAGQRTADLVAQYSAANDGLSRLVHERPVDVYQFFTDLRDELGPGVLVQDLVVQDGAFQLQAIGPSPLPLMQRFISDPRFQEVRLLQTTPLAEGSRQQFIVTGRYTR